MEVNQESLVEVVVEEIGDCILDCSLEVELVRNHLEIHSNLPTDNL